MSAQTMFKAVIFDIGGVVQESPIAGISQHCAAKGIPDCNKFLESSEAWQRLLKGQLSPQTFVQAVEVEARNDPDQRYPDGLDAIGLLHRIEDVSTTLRSEMVNLIQRLKQRGFKVAALTNNFPDPPPHTNANVNTARATYTAKLRSLFDVFVESAKVNLIKPDPRIYQLALKELGVVASEAVFLDDIGINLKPAKAMGIYTIKVVNTSPASFLQAVYELERVVGFPRSNL